jgi:hypothetical protein
MSIYKFFILIYDVSYYAILSSVMSLILFIINISLFLTLCIISINSVNTEQKLFQFDFIREKNIVKSISKSISVNFVFEFIVKFIFHLNTYLKNGVNSDTYYILFFSTLFHISILTMLILRIFCRLYSHSIEKNNEKVIFIILISLFSGVTFYFTTKIYRVVYMMTLFYEEIIPQYF